MLWNRKRKQKMDRNILKGDPGRKTCFGPVNSGSRRATFHREGHFLAWGGDLHLGERILEPEICDVPLAVVLEVPITGVIPRAAEFTPTCETNCSLSDGFDMPFTFPTPPKRPAASAAAPLPTDVIVHGFGFTAFFFGGV